MANIIVNTNDQVYSQVTANRGVRGLGLPILGESTQSPGRILVSDAIISSKLARIRALREEFQNYSGAALNRIDDDYGTARDEDSVIYRFRQRMVQILFAGQPIPDEARGDKGGSWFNAWSSAPYSIFGKNRFQSRDNAVRVMTDWITLLTSILEYKPGLAEREPSPQTQVTFTVEADESSRVEGNFGTITVIVKNVEISLTTAILSASAELIAAKTSQFFDEVREYKTILNFGDDKQYVLEAWRPVSDTSSVQLKLIKPLESGINLYDEAYIVREFAHPVIDIINVELPPEVDNTPYLRPANTNVGRFDINKQSIKNATLSTLGLDTGASGTISGSNISYDDRVFNRWFTADFDSSELNIDFSKYDNFVSFGSAKARLSIFANKLQQIQSYGTQISVSSSNAGERKLASERENIIRNFDLYEQYLYFASQSNAYSASAYYVDGGVEYNPTGSWPKNEDTQPIEYINVEDWYVTQSAIAERFDEFNPNYLVKHLPEHIQEDSNSSDFITFIQMFGHVMDNIKVYIDKFSDIYSTNPDPFKELTMDQVYEVAKSFGIDLPNTYSLEELETFISSLYDGPGARSRLAETWKRFLHSSIYLKKLKGSRTGTDAVINTFGLNSPLVQLKESTYAVEGNYIKSEELVYGLQFNKIVSSSIRIPFVSSSYTASTLQIRFVAEEQLPSSLLSSDGTWAIDIIPHPSSSNEVLFNTQSRRDLTSYYTLQPQIKNYGKINLVSGSSRTIIASSSYFPVFSDVYTHIMLRSQSQDMTIIQTDGDQILFQESSSVMWGTLWNNTTHLYLGATGSIKLGVFDGIIDDVRVWGENTTTDNFIKQAYDPGSYYGTNYSS